MINRDQASLRRLLEEHRAYVDSVDPAAGTDGMDPALYDALDALDESGYAPIHYACIFKLPAFIQLLIEYGANVYLADGGVVDAGLLLGTSKILHALQAGAGAGVDPVAVAAVRRPSALSPPPGGVQPSPYSPHFSPLHWSAVQMDIPSLDLLAQHIYDKDSLLDAHLRSPLALLCLEGRDGTGCSNPNLLAKCLTLLLDRHSDVNAPVPSPWTELRVIQETHPITGAVPVPLPQQYTCLHLLAAGWQYEACNVLLKQRAHMGFVSYNSASGGGGGSIPGVSSGARVHSRAGSTSSASGALLLDQGGVSGKYTPGTAAPAGVVEYDRSSSTIGYTPLHMAALGQSPRYLLGEGECVPACL